MARSSETRESGRPGGAGRRLRAAALALGALLLGAWALAWAVPLPERLSLPGSTVVQWRDGSAAHVFLAPDERWRIPTALDEVDPDYIEALVALEDARFWWHPGVDPLAVARAAVQNLRAGRVVSGASTITMQVVRLSEPRPRTLRSKVLEALRAVQLEVRLSKAEILSAYLDLVPYGANVEGVEAGSLALFGHSAGELGPAEICTLLAVPQDPAGRRPSPAHAPRLAAARDDICARLGAVGALPLGDAGAPRELAVVLAEVAEQPVPTSLRPQPRAAPHAALWLRGGSTAPRLPTTLDRGVQQLAERALDRVRRERQRQGIHNAAVVVVEQENAEIRALVGSFDFWEAEHGGQIPAFARPRSPGSTLKPFVYAEAIDAGTHLPQTLVRDVPVQYGAYSPENYDGSNAGMVSLEEALARSLNVPFVDLLAEQGVEPFLGRLRSGGVRSLVDTPGHYGLSAVVGGTELTPLELAGLYVALASEGRARPLRARPLREGQSRSAGIPLMAPGAAFLTLEALRQRDRPDFPDRAALARLPRRIAWKTGTSFGHRDAWAVGVGERYTVVVWLGNLDQTPSGHLVGATAAGPVLFDLLEGLGDGLSQPARPSSDLVDVDLCALSGRLPRASCPHRTDALALRHAVPTARCELHQAVEVDVLTGEQVGPGCRAGRETRREVVVAWPAAVRRFLAERHRALPSPPDLAAGCRVAQAAEPPRITSPARGETTLLLPGVPAEDQELPLIAESSRLGGRLSWFVDGAFVGSTTGEEQLWWTPVPGEHEVLVMDERGASDRVEVGVRR